MATATLTNEAFGQKVGCSHSMASRLRAGKRLPSASLMSRICEAFDIDPATAMRAHSRGPESFARLLKKSVR